MIDESKLLRYCKNSSLLFEKDLQVYGSDATIKIWDMGMNIVSDGTIGWLDSDNYHEIKLELIIKNKVRGAGSLIKVHNKFSWNNDDNSRTTWFSISKKSESVQESINYCINDVCELINAINANHETFLKLLSTRREQEDKFNKEISSIDIGSMFEASGI